MYFLPRSLALVFASGIFTHVRADDYPPAPVPKTVEWTLATAWKPKLHDVQVEDLEVGKVIERLDAPMGLSAGHYLEVDVSAVQDRLGRRITIKAADIPWMLVLAKVADVMEAEIVVQPGKLILKPRQPAKAASGKVQNGEKS